MIEFKEQIVKLENEQDESKECLWGETLTHRTFRKSKKEIEEAIKVAYMSCVGNCYHLPTLFKELGLEKMSLVRVYCDEIEVTC